MGTILVERIDGTYDNVVGLPLKATLHIMEKVLLTAGLDDVGDEALVNDEDLED